MSKVWSRAAKTEVEIQVSIIVRYITAQPPARTRKTVSAPHLVNPPPAPPFAPPSAPPPAGAGRLFGQLVCAVSAAASQNTNKTTQTAKDTVS